MAALQALVAVLAMGFADASVSVLAGPPLECQSLSGPQRHVPQFHVIPALQHVGGGVWWPGDLNDANAVFEHQGVFHVMFQTPRDPAASGGGGTGPHAWGHVVSQDLVHWTRLPPTLAPTSDSKKYDGQDGDCDGTISFVEGLGPILMWGPDCADQWQPPRSADAGQSLRGQREKRKPHKLGDYPRVAVARPANPTDRLMTGWVKDAQNPIEFQNLSHPCGFPGTVWQAQGQYHLVCQEWGVDPVDPVHAVYLPWIRYSTADKNLHGPWKVADEVFAEVPGAGGRGASTVSSPSFTPLVEPQPGEPTYIINCGMGTSFCLGNFDEQRQRLVNVTRPQAVDNGQWYVTGVAETKPRILHVGWVKVDNAPPGDVLKPVNTMSAVRVLSYDRAASRLVASPAEEYINLRGGALFERRDLLLTGGQPFAIPLEEGAGAATDLEIVLALPEQGEALSFAVQVLASPAGWSGAATTLSVNVTAAPPGGGPKHGVLTQQAARMKPSRLSQDFTMPAEETEISLRVLVDRSIVESFAAGGRAVLTMRDYPAEGEFEMRLLAVGDAPVRVKRMGVWSMGCGWNR